MADNGICANWSDFLYRPLLAMETTNDATEAHLPLANAALFEGLSHQEALLFLFHIVEPLLLMPLAGPGCCKKAQQLYPKGLEARNRRRKPVASACGACGGHEKHIFL